jgi:hypothetical protein
MEFHSEVQLVNTEKNPDYSELVLTRILEEVLRFDDERVIGLFSALSDLAEQKELLIAMTNSAQQASFSSLGWGGALVEPACPIEFGQGECLIDSFMQVEANVGVNKANYYLDRQIDHTISLTDKTIGHKRVINYKNKAQIDSWPKGPYKNYLRFYLPLEAEKVKIYLNSQRLADGSLIVKNELGRKVVGVLIEVGVSSEVKLELDYSLPYSKQTPFSYIFFDQKQAGARDVSPRVFLQHSPDLTPTLIAPQAEVQGEVIVFNPTTNSGHMFVGATFE